jgi:hypothetical protein
LETGGCESGGICRQVRQTGGVTEDWSKKTHLTQQEIGQTLKERWNIQTSENCQAATDEVKNHTTLALLSEVRLPAIRQSGSDLGR